MHRAAAPPQQVTYWSQTRQSGRRFNLGLICGTRLGFHESTRMNRRGHNLKVEISDLKKKGAMEPFIGADWGKGRRDLAKKWGQKYDATAFRVAKFIGYQPQGRNAPPKPIRVSTLG